MAKAKPSLSGLIKRTEGQTDTGVDAEVPSTGRTIPIGMGLKESELAILDTLADELGVARNALLRFSVRFMLREYRAGRLDLRSAVEAPVAKKRLRMP